MNEMSAVNAIRILSADQVQAANSGHPGLPLGAAPIAYELWAKHMNHNPKAPKWLNRDRFVLSAGHGSAMLYSLLHLFGYGLDISQLKDFRQLNSLAPGHPEYGHTMGVEATTGPLGAGLGMAVGMAMAEEHLAKQFNRDGFKVFDHHTYVLCGDGCLMEGISSEVMSLAGNQELSKLIVLYDSNSITIEGSADIAFSEDVSKRFEAFGFQTLSVADGNDIDAIGKAIEEAKADTQRPSFIKITTVIGYGVPEKEGKANAHGEPLGEENIKILREKLGWESTEPFEVPDEVYSHYNKLAEKGASTQAEWEKMFADYAKKYPELKQDMDNCFSGNNAEALIDSDDFWRKTNEKPEATRATSGKIINYVKDIIPELVGGSADLGPSNKTTMKDVEWFSKEHREGRNIHFGVREIGMTAIANGMLLHGGLKTFAATFMVFSDYMKPMLRLSSLMNIPQIAVLTHDSIGVGEDGPTHQPVEQLTMLRSLPNMDVWRPADEMETKAAWCSALNSKKTPTSIVLSRQGLPVLNNSSKKALMGGYILSKEDGDKPDIILMASGSEVGVALEAKERLALEGRIVRVVSMPCMEIFDMQDEDYREEVLPKACRKRIAIEAGCNMPWGKYVGIDGAYVTMDGFGASAPAKQLFEKFGINAENVAKKARDL